MPAPETPPSNDEAAAMLWDEARRLLVRQEATLDTLRGQAVAILSVASIVAGLFGSRLLPTQQLSHFSVAMLVLALAAFAATAVLALVILRPQVWHFEHGLASNLGTLGRGGDVLAAAGLAYTWAKGVEGQRAANKRRLDRLMTCFAWACGLTGASVLFWGLALV